MECDIDVDSHCNVDIDIDIVKMEIDEVETNVIEKSFVTADYKQSKMPLREVKVVLDRSSIDDYYKRKREVNNNDASPKLKGAGKQMTILNFFKKSNDDKAVNDTNKENQADLLNENHSEKRQLRGNRNTSYAECDANSGSDNEENSNDVQPSSASIKKSAPTQSNKAQSDTAKYIRLYCSSCDKTYERGKDGRLKGFAGKYNRKLRHCPGCQKLLEYMCLKCKKVYKHVDSTYIHLKKNCKLKLNLKKSKPDYPSLIKLHCSSCNKNYDRSLQGGKISATEYKKNLTHCSDCQKPLVFQCTKCKKNYKGYNGAYSHVKDTCERQLFLKCEKCDFVAPSKTRLKLHDKLVHTVIDKKDYVKCSKCEREFKNLKYLQKHLQRNFSCSPKDILSCSLCHFKTKSKDYFKFHSKEHESHANDNDYKPEQPSENEIISVDDFTTGHVRIIEPPLKLQNKSPKIYNHVNWCHDCKLEKSTTSTSINGAVDCPQCKKSMKFKCEKCGAFYKNLRNLQYHMKNNCNKYTYYHCDHCDKKFIKKRTLRQHLTAIHMDDAKVDNGFFKCKNCNKLIDGESRYLHHLIFCGKAKRIACQLCSSFKTNFSKDLVKHIQRVHKGVRKKNIDKIVNDAIMEANQKNKEFKLQLRGIDKQADKIKYTTKELDNLPDNNSVSTKSGWMYIEEVKKALPYIQPYCSKCDHVNKEKHIRSRRCEKCNAKNRFRYLKCPKNWSDFTGVVYHVKVEHLLTLEQRMLYQCGKCFHRFNFYENLQRHWKSCLSTDTFKCDHCNRVLKHKRTLVNHIRKLHMGLAKRVKCKKCKTRFRNDEELQEHQEAEDCVNKYFWCDHCEKRFEMKSRLIDHIKLTTEFKGK